MKPRNRFLAACAASALLAVGSAFAGPMDATTRLTITANDAVLNLGSAKERNVPVLVRLATADLADAGDGSTLYFTDESGDRLAHEIDTWNADGTSLVWVKIPALTAKTKFYAWCGGTAVASNATEVWADYTGVWHLNDSGSGEAGSTVFDSTANALNGTAVAQATSLEGGVIGGSWRIMEKAEEWKETRSTGCIKVPAADALDVAPVFTVDAWVKSYVANKYYAYLISRKERDSTKAWGIQFPSDKVPDSLNCWYGDNGGDGQKQRAHYHHLEEFLPDVWCKMTVVYGRDENGYRATLYVNGVLRGDSEYFNAAPVDGTSDLILGGAWYEGGFSGEMDEVRLSVGALSQSRATLDYVIETKADAFLSSDVRAASAAPLFAQPRFTVDHEGVRLTASLTRGAAKLVARVNGADYPLTEGVVNAGEEVSAVLPGVSANTAFVCVLSAQDESGATLTTRESTINGVVSVARLADANEDGLVAGGFTVTCSTPVSEDLVVNYMLDGSAVNGVAYEELPGFVTIPAGASSATIPVKPLWSPVETPVDTRVILTLATGSYIVSGGSAKVKIINKDVGEAAKFKYAVRLDVGYTGAEPVRDVAIPVRISESRIAGFSYAGFLKADFSDLAILDANGAYLPYDVEKLDPNGESVVWIRFAELQKGAVAYLVYGCKKTIPSLKAQMWAGYTGVWHLSDGGSGAARSPIADATGNALTGTAYANAKSVSGVVGGGWMMADDADDWKQGQNHGCVKVPAADALKVAPVFTVTSWVKCYLANKRWGYLISRKDKDYTNGWGLQFNGESPDRIRFWYDGNEGKEHHVTPWYPHLQYFLPNEWCKMTVVYGADKDEGGNDRYFAVLYVNDVRTDDSPYYFDYAPKDGDFDLIIGGCWNDNPLSGEMDEVRISKGMRTPEQIAVEYAAESNPNYVIAGVARELPHDPKGFVVVIR